MGIINPSSPLHGASGRSGDYVLYTVNGKTYFRYSPPQISNPRTPAQCLQRNRLLSVQTLYKSVKKCLLREVWNTASSIRGKRSGYTYFTSRNINIFGKDDYTDYSKLQLSDGKLQLPDDFRLEQTAEKGFTLKWTDNSEQQTASATDGLMLGVIFPEEPYRICLFSELPATRQDEEAILDFPVSDQPLHLYAFFASASLKAFSPDRYFCIHPQK